jgi:hypothetical protein
LIKDNLEKIKSRIDSVDHSQQVTLIAVSKTRSVLEIQSAVDAGQYNFGENYLQEALDKIEALKNNTLVWHFIGPIQSNKTAKIAEIFDWVHSVDRIKVAKRLNEQRPPDFSKLNILIQVNIDNEPTKSGILLNEVTEFVRQCDDFENIRLRGFMCIPNPQNSSNSFSLMAKILSEFSSLDALSMGMSGDMEIAIKNGATLVRIGTDIFGKRSYV